MKIFPGVTWHPYAEKVYVHSVDSQHDYIFEGIALDVLNFFAEHDDASFENLCEKLSAEYAIDDADYLEMLPTSQKPGSGELITSTTCCAGSMARCLDGTFYMLNGDDEWVEYSGWPGICL